MTGELHEYYQSFALAVCASLTAITLAAFTWGEETYIVVWARLPTGAQLERADAIAKFFEERIVGQSQVARVFTRVSAEYANLANHVSESRAVFRLSL